MQQYQFGSRIFQSHTFFYCTVHKKAKNVDFCSPSYKETGLYCGYVWLLPHSPISALLTSLLPSPLGNSSALRDAHSYQSSVIADGRTVEFWSELWLISLCFWNRNSCCVSFPMWLDFPHMWQKSLEPKVGTLFILYSVDEEKKLL